MTKAAIARIVLPVLEEFAGDAARELLNPCVRYLWWERLYERWESKGRDILAALAFRRARANRRKCESIGKGRCDTESVLAKAWHALRVRVAPERVA